MQLGQTVRHCAFAHCACFPPQKGRLLTATQLRSQIARSTRTALRSWRPIAAQRTAIATDDESNPEDFPAESVSNFSASQARRTTPTPKPVSIAKLIPAVLQLLVGIGSLLILPAWWFCKAVPGELWALAALYSVFFGFGAIRRVIKYGKLSSRQQDAQAATGKRIWDFISFIVTVGAGHWAATYYYGHLPIGRGFLIKLLKRPFQQAVQVVAVAVMSAALALHLWSCETLGKAYDRLVVPDKLVRTGPYAWCQHPIYTSYMMLFSGYALFCMSEPSFLILWYACLQYYGERTAIEANLLQEKFGNEYKAYQEHTGLFWPRLL